MSTRRKSTNGGTSTRRHRKSSGHSAGVATPIGHDAEHVAAGSTMVRTMLVAAVAASAIIASAAAGSGIEVVGERGR